MTSPEPLRRHPPDGTMTPAEEALYVADEFRKLEWSSLGQSWHPFAHITEWKCKCGRVYPLATRRCLWCDGF